jgi:hypothetical protein
MDWNNILTMIETTLTAVGLQLLGAMFSTSWADG